MHPTRVSSSFTIFLKIFIPTVWIIFFGAFTLFILLTGRGAGIIALPGVKIGAVIFYALGFLLLWTTIMDLKRVELADDHFFVTNYFKTYRYTYDSLSRINEIDLLVLTVVVFTFVEKSSFGKKISFMSRGKVWKDYIEANPDKFAHLG